MKYQVTACIVMYKNNPEMLRESINSFLRTTLHVRLFLVDNSPTDALRLLATDDRIEYIFNNANIGFGKAHNIALRKALAESTYHLVLNPDVYFDAGTIEKIYDYAEAHPDVGQVMPKIVYPSGEIQRLCKLLPTPTDLFLRRFFPFWAGAARRTG